MGHRTLDQIAAEILAHKDADCGFEPCATCTNMVPGEGSATAEVMFIGEAPGKNEDLQGRPFVGQAGKLLDRLIESIGMTREDVFIANVLKGRPPGNRDPLPGEAEHHWPWLEEQIAAVDPKLIVLLGRHAMKRFLPHLRIGEAHGQVQDARRPADVCRSTTRPPRSTTSRSSRRCSTISPRFPG